MVPAKGGPKNLNLKSSWHRRRRSKILAVTLKHWKGRRGGSRGCTPRTPPVYSRSNTSLGQVRPLLPGAGAGSSSTQHPPAPGRTLGLDGHGDGVLAGPAGGVARHRDGVDHPLVLAVHLQAPRVVRVRDGLHLGGVPAEHVARLDRERHGLGDDVLPDRHLEQPGRPHLLVLVRGAGRPPDLELQLGGLEGLELPADDVPGPRDRVVGDEVHPGAGVPHGPAVRGVADGHQCAWKKARVQSGLGVDPLGGSDGDPRVWCKAGQGAGGVIQAE